MAHTYGRPSSGNLTKAALAAGVTEAELDELHGLAVSAQPAVAAAATAALIKFDLRIAEIAFAQIDNGLDADDYLRVEHLAEHSPDPGRRLWAENLLTKVQKS